MDYVPIGRTLHLIDLENLMGGAQSGIIRATQAVSDYRSAIPVHSHDHAHVSVNPALFIDAGTVWPGARYLVGKGRDGADKALITSVSNVHWIARRYDQLVIGSGDHIFTEVAIAFTDVGTQVFAIARTGSLSQNLRLAATDVIEIPAREEVHK